MASSTHSLVIVPTYNERDNLPRLLADLKAFVPSCDVLIVDDGSTDGTEEWCLGRDKSKGNFFLIERGKKLGLASAYKCGFAWAFENGYETIVQMDADGSHQVKDLRKLLDVFEKDSELDLLIGSRWISDGKVEGWSASRYFLSRFANWYTRLILGYSIRDSTAGFRIYRAESLKRIDLDSLKSEGYGFQIELTFAFHTNEMRIMESPITFIERISGVSKMSRFIIFEAFLRVLRLGWKRANL